MMMSAIIMPQKIKTPLFIFGTIASGKKMIKDEDEGSLTENFVHQLDNFPQTEENENKEH